ncbi:MAG: phosphate signaling complex protein PhoU [Armatimonadetes bacterium]|nr:phosphate signaling complex protein PhoU [Armatimonadota bacterium]
MDQHSPARQAYTAQISELEQDVLEMASKADSMVGRAVDSLISLDTDAALAVVHSDNEIDRLDLDIESKCLRILALQQPMGSDLREVGAVMKIVTDLERIGDLAVDLAKSGMKIEKELGETSYVDLRRISNVSRQMIRSALQAFIKRDGSHLTEVEELEEQVDGMYRDLRGQIHDYMRHRPDQVVAASWLLLAVHHVERVADHAVNIAERVGFMVTGELRQLAED